MSFNKIRGIVERNCALVIICLGVVLFLVFDGTGYLRGCIRRAPSPIDTISIGLDSTSVFLEKVDTVGSAAIALSDSIDDGIVPDSVIDEELPGLRQRNDSIKAKYRRPKTVGVCRLSKDSVTYITTLYSVPQIIESNEDSCDDCDIGEPYWPEEDLCGEGVY